MRSQVSAWRTVWKQCRSKQHPLIFQEEGENQIFRKDLKHLQEYAIAKRILCALRWKVLRQNYRPERLHIEGLPMSEMSLAA